MAQSGLSRAGAPVGEYSEVHGKYHDHQLDLQAAVTIPSSARMECGHQYIRYLQRMRFVAVVAQGLQSRLSWPGTYTSFVS